MSIKSFFRPSILLFCMTFLWGNTFLHAQESSSHSQKIRLTKIFDCNCNIRALSVKAQQIFFAGSRGIYGYFQTAGDSLIYKEQITAGATNPDFRALSRTTKKDYILSAGNPALIYEVDENGRQRKLYEQTREGTFYDAMSFWNAEEGIIIGDPIDQCMTFTITRDAGKNWKILPCKKLPESIKGETAFAASNSNIATIGNKTWVLSGGATTRVYYSPNKGKTWQVYDTPLINGKSTTGGYSIDFYDENIGVIFGGDYTDQSANETNKALTTDGGKTWYLLADHQPPGYKSCVRFVPKSEGKQLVAVGPTGISYSTDAGKTWKQVSDKGLYTIRFLNANTAYGAGKNGIYKIEFSGKEHSDY